MTETIFENRFMLEKNLADIVKKYPNLLVKDIDLDMIKNDIDLSKNSKFYDFIRNFKYFNMHKFDTTHITVSDLKKELKRIYVINDIRANNPYLQPNKKEEPAVDDSSKSGFRTKKLSKCA